MELEFHSFFSLTQFEVTVKVLQHQVLRNAAIISFVLHNPKWENN